MNEGKVWYVCPMVRMWSEVQTSAVGLTVPIQHRFGPEFGVGFLEVYDSLEAYTAEYPDVQPWIVRAIKTDTEA